MHLCVFAKQNILKSKVDSILSGNSVAVKKMTSWFQKGGCFFFFQSHIARRGEEDFVVFIDSQALNLHTEIQIQKDVLQYCPISSGHRVGSTALGATRQQQICYQAAKEIKMYFKMSLWCTLSIFYFSKNTAYLLEISLMC